MGNTLFFVFLAFLCCFQQRTVEAGRLVNYCLIGSQGQTLNEISGDSKTISFDASTGTLTLGAQTMTQITQVTPFSGTLLVGSNPFASVFAPWQFSGSIAGATNTVVLAQGYDSTTDVDPNQSTITVIALTVQQWIIAQAQTQTSLEGQIMSGMSAVWTALQDQLLSVGMDVGDDGNARLRVTFDVASVTTQNLYDVNVFTALRNKVFAVIDPTQVIQIPTDASSPPSMVADTSSSTTDTTTDTSTPPTTTTTTTTDGTVVASASDPSSSDPSSDPSADPNTNTVSLLEKKHRVHHQHRNYSPHHHGHHTRFTEAKAGSLDYSLIVTIGSATELAELSQLSHQPTLSLIEDEESRRHHHHRTDHQHHRFSSREELMTANALMGTTANQPLAGGASIGVKIDKGTMGGIVISPLATASASDSALYQLHAMTNFHVASGSDDVCQPDYFSSNPLKCNHLGTVEVSCCSQSQQTNPGQGMDVSIIPINSADRWNTICSQYRQVQQSPKPKASVQDISGAGLVAQNDRVTKYGARTFKTSGTAFVAKTKFGQTIGVKPIAMPDFADANPVSSKAPTPTGFSGNANTIPKRTNPTNEPNYFDTTCKAGVQALIMKQTPSSSTSGSSGGTTTAATTFTQAQADQIFDTLWANNRIIGTFSEQGDSGSWIVRDSDNAAVGIISVGGWEEQEPKDLNILGHKWGTFQSVDLGYGMRDCLDNLNKLLAANSAFGFSVEVCTEASRPKPPASATNANVADCSSATITNGVCRWPYTCKPNPGGTACVPRP